MSRHDAPPARIGPGTLSAPSTAAPGRQPAPFKRPERAKAAARDDGIIELASITAPTAINEPVAAPTDVVGPPPSAAAGGRRFVKDDPGNWDFYDERMINLRRLLQMTFLADMFTARQAAFNRWLGLSKRSRLFSDDPRGCWGFGTALRWALYAACIATCLTALATVTFNLPRNGKGLPDYTQLPIKLTFLIFSVEVLTTMLCFSGAAKSFASLHIPRPTVSRVATAMLVFCCSLFWLSYAVVFFSFIFYKSDQLNAGQKDFPSDMYRMHKNWIGPWMDAPPLLFLYAAAMFVAFSVYIVSNSVFAFYIWCIWMQARALVSAMRSGGGGGGNFKALLADALPILINEQKHLKLQWRAQIIIYIVLDVLLLTCFALELQFIIFNGEECFIASTPILLYMLNVFIHLFSFLFGIAILNDAFSSIEDAAWKCSGWRIAPHLRSPEQASACKDAEVCMLLLGLSTNKIQFRIGPAAIDWGFISTVSGLAATAYGLATPSLGPLGEYRVCS